MARSLLVIGLLQFLALLVGVLRAKGLSMSLGPDGLGIVSTIDQIVLTATQLGALGLPFTALKYMSRAHSESLEAFRRLSARFIRAIFLLAGAITCISAAFVFLQPTWLGEELSSYVAPILVALIGIVPLMTNALLVNVLASAQKPGAAAALTFALAVTQGIAAVAGAALGGIMGMYVATAGAGLVVTAGSFFFLRAETGVSLFGRGDLSPAFPTRDANIAITAASVYATMVAYAGALLAVRYAVLVQSGETDAGLLHAALSIALTAGSLLTAMSGLYLAPALNRATTVTSKIQLAHDFAGHMLALFMIGAIPVILFSGLTVSLLFTDAFRPAAVLIAGLLVWQCIYQGMNVYQQLLIGLNELRFMAAAAVLGLFTAASLAVFFVSKYGPGVVSIGLIGGAFLSAALMVLRLRLRHNTTIPARLLVRVALIVGSIAVAHMWFQPHSELQAAGVFARLAFAGLCYLLLCLQLTPTERGQIGKIYEAALKRFGLFTARRSPDS